jgi:hypothetical protein
VTTLVQGKARLRATLIEDLFEQRQAEDLAHLLIRRHQNELAAQPLGRGVPAHERPHATAVDGRHQPHIDDDAMNALTQTGLNLRLQLLGGATPHQPLMGREHEFAGFRPVLKQTRHV